MAKKAAEKETEKQTPKKSKKETKTDTYFGERKVDSCCVLLRCSCKHEFQDERYGEGLRVHNLASSQGKHPDRWRCTVCKTTRSGPVSTRGKRK